MKLEPGQFYRTRSGQKVKIYEIVASSYMGVMGAVFNPGNGWDICSWTLAGNRVGPEFQHKQDIVGPWREKTARRIAWANAVGVVGMFEEDLVPSDVSANGTRLPWLDEPV